ncbi:MAG TPA: protein translocase subunit SecF [Thermoanaerobaculia bacterium]|nr:protein translocase subunit SecF [Thermoanaerobaculia bacterium]
MELLRDTNIDFMKYRKFWIIVSLVLVGIGVFAVFFHGNLNVGVDFAGGTQLTLQFREKPETERLRTILSQHNLEDAEITRFGTEDENEVMIRTRLVKGKTEGTRDVIEKAVDKAYNGEQAAGKIDVNRVGADGLAALLLAADPDNRKVQGEDAARAHYADVAKKIMDKRRETGLFTSWNDLSGIPGASPQAVSALQQRAALGAFTVTGVENVGPQIGKELRQQGFWAVALSLLGMLVYIWIRFELRFGVGAIMACIHDVLVTLGLFALFGFEFNLTTIAAFLTLIGYSVNDTVVIFDRIRENMRKSRRKPLIEVMNESINQTLSRTLLTGGSTLLALAALLWLGGDVIRGFAFVMLVGILVGTYSSIYVASPFALLWEQYFGAKGERRAAPARTDGEAQPVRR